MRLIFVNIVILLIFTFVLHSQSNTFVIHGMIHGVNQGKLTIYQPKLDSVYWVDNNEIEIKDGEFRISGYLSIPMMTFVSIVDESDNLFESNWFYMDNGDQNLDITISEGSIELSSNAVTFVEYFEEYKPTLDSLNSQRAKIKKTIKSAQEAYSGGIIVDSLNRLYEVALVQRAIYVLNYVMNNPKSYVGMSGLANSIGRYGNIPIYETAYQFLDDKLKRTVKGRQILQNIEYSQILMTGLMFPSLKLENERNEEVILTPKGEDNYTLIDFWFHSCGACIDEFPDLKRIYSKYHDDGFQIIGISSDRQNYEANWKKAIKKYELPWIQLWDRNGVNCNKYFVNYFPTTYLLNGSGEIIAKNMKLEELDRYLYENIRN